MRVIVSDTSCIIDLHKAALLEEFVTLPYTVVMPLPLFEDEALSLSRDTKNRLQALGLEVINVSSEGVTKAMRYANKYSALMVNDCFALVVAEDTEQSILLTGDKRLKNVAIDHGIDTHGVLWATDEMFEHDCCPINKLYDGLNRLHDDPLVFIPGDLIRARIRKYQ
ncbi:MAG: hypothetical protein DRR42_01825 [Gammaproteobacteria bacterium]|nr:MAG: hypothetical protein DRR42_01825 [Gammaproteobacteria bacterium]